MPWRLAADAVLVLHLAFIVFAALGALLALRTPRVLWLQIPAALWGFLVEAAGWYCPLTTLENRLRQKAGDAGYAGGFIEHYLTLLIYPPGLTRPQQGVLALLLIAVNAGVYLWLWRKHQGRSTRQR